MDIQAAINACPPEGGKVYIPSGVHNGPALNLRHNVILIGQGFSTVIPTINGQSSRVFGCGLRDLIVDSAITDGTPGYVIDWRNVTNGTVRHVVARNGNYGLIMLGNAYYNQIDHLFVDVSHTAIELSGHANTNTFIGGKWTAPIGVHEIGDANGNTFLGVSFERGDPMEFRKQSSGGGLGSRFTNCRCEYANPPFGPTWLNS